MGRPQKDSVEYFPHYVNQGKTMFILEQQYGNDGYAFWFKLLELLASAEGHVYDCNNDSEWLFLQARTHLTEDVMRSILETLSNVGAIDKDLWKEKKVWSQNLVNNLQPVYANRRRSLPQKPVSTCKNSIATNLLQVETTAQQDILPLSTVETPQSKVKRVKRVKKGIVREDCLFLGPQKNVRLTQEELDDLTKQYPFDVNDMIHLLSLHISEKGDTSTAPTHIFTIKKWVIDAVLSKKKNGWKGFSQIATPPPAQRGPQITPSKSKWEQFREEHNEV